MTLSSLSVGEPAAACVMQESPRIILASNCAYSDLYAGVLDYCRERGWLLDASMIDQPGWMPSTEGCSGILAVVSQRPLAEWLVASGLPTTRLLHSHLALPPWPAVVVDYEAVGRLGAQHLLEVGNAHFAFYRFYSDAPDINECHDGFIAEMKTHGHAVHELDIGALACDGTRPVATRTDRVKWLAEKIRSLPLPLAVMAPDDRYAVDVVLAARNAGLRIPEDIAILGAEDQPFIRRAVTEEISSIDVNFQEVGRRGCELLDRMLQCANPGSKEVPLLVKVPPREVIVRHSTATFACDHPGVTAAAVFLRKNFQESITVADIAAHANMSLRTLQAEYPRRVGCTLKDDILKARLKRARFLLERTDLKLSAVAVESGFGKAEYLCRVFQTNYHTTPHAWRQQHRQGGNGAPADSP